MGMYSLHRASLNFLQSICLLNKQDQYFQYSNYKSIKNFRSRGTNLAISGHSIYYSHCFSGLLLITEINYFEWLWLCIARSYEKDYFEGEISQHFSGSCFTVLKRSLQFWDILNTSLPASVKSMRTIVRDTHEFRKEKYNVFATPFPPPILVSSVWTK